MKKTLIFLTLFVLIASTCFAETWRVTWASVAATTQGASPSTYISLDTGTVNANGVPITKTEGISATCFTVGANATDTDFNFLYDSQTANAHVCANDVGEATNDNCPITSVGNYLKFTADNDYAADAVVPYCDVIIW